MKFGTPKQAIAVIAQVVACIIYLFIFLLIGAKLEDSVLGTSDNGLHFVTMAIAFLLSWFLSDITTRKLKKNAEGG
jgi:hypothetical protein